MDWYPHYINDYDRDTLHLTTLEHGADRLLIDAYMRFGQPLPDDDEILARIAKLEPTAWAAIAPTIRAFFVTRDSRLCHKRCHTELTKQSEKRENAAKRQRRKRLKSNELPEEPVTRESHSRGQDILRRKKEGQNPIPKMTSLGAPRRLSPADKRQLWAGKISNEICRRESPDRAIEIINAWQRGEKWAKDEFNRVDQIIRANGKANQ
jgi:uncharacterized protein YdaU (DUF1376 family)